MPRHAMVSEDPSTAGLPFSAAASGGGLLYLSGQIGLDAGALADGVAAQTKTAISLIARILSRAGKTLDDVVKVNVYLTDMAHFSEMNAAYAAGFTEPYPARTCVAVKALPLGALVEIEAVAQ